MVIEKDLIIGLDCSTSSCKAIVWDLHGKAVSTGRCSIPTLRPHPVWHEQSAESWWAATQQAISEAVSQINPVRLAAISISVQRETFVPVDVRGKPLRNAILWMDERARPLLDELKQQYGKDHFHQITGKPFSGNLSVGKIAWLRQYEPEVYGNVYKFLDVHGFLVYSLTGKFSTSWGCADPMGLFDMTHKQWSEEILAGLGLFTGHFPSTIPPAAIIGEITTEAAVACQLPPGLLVAAGLGDGQAAGLGANVTGSGEAYLNLGTAIVSGSYTHQYIVNNAFRSMIGGIPGTYYLETVLLGGTYLINWFVDTLAGFKGQDLGIDLKTEEILDTVTKKVPPGALGLMLVPYWNSAMNPYWDAAASGIMVGWRGDHQRQHIYRAILEGIAFEQRLQTQGVEDALKNVINRFVVVGGGSSSDLWRQIIADITGKPLFRSQTTEASALGAGILAATAAGFFPGLKEAAESMTSISTQPIEPDPIKHQYYTQLYEEVYIHLFPALQKYLTRLTELTAHDQ